MLIKPSTYHLSIFRPCVVCIQCRMNTDKALSIIFDKGHHVLFLSGVHIQLSGCAGEDQDVKVVQVLGIFRERLFCKQFGIRANCGIPESTLLTHGVNSGHRSRDRVMLETFCLANYKNMLQMDLFRMWWWCRKG